MSVWLSASRTSWSSADEAFGHNNLGLNFVVFLELTENFVFAQETRLVCYAWCELPQLLLTDQENAPL